MNSYQAFEYDTNTLEQTGRTLTFLGNDDEHAIRSALYTARLTNGAAKLGPTGRVVYLGDGKAWCIPKPKVAVATQV